MEGAISYTRSAIEEQSRLPGDLRLGMHNFLNNLGVLLLTKGDSAEAERVLLEAVEIALKTVGEKPSEYRALSREPLESVTV